jgi:hypothetical protein
LGRAVSEPDEHFAALVKSLRRRAGVTIGRMFGSDALKIGDKTFAMLVKGRLVVKLPRRRVDELIMAGAGERFDPGHGRLMKEWLAVPPGPDWRTLADEAFAFVKGG